MRSTQTAHLTYALDARDRFVNAGPTERHTPSPSGAMYRIGNTRGLPNGMWGILFPDAWNGTRFGPEMRCPNDPAWKAGAPGPSSELPVYWMSMALWLDPATLREPMRPDVYRWRDNQVSDVVFPSSKVLLFEQVAYCETNPKASFNIENGHTADWPGANGFVDGSVRRFARMAGLPGYHTLPFDATVDGVRGRDVP